VEGKNSSGKKKPSPASRVLVLGTGALMTLSLFIEPACGPNSTGGGDAVDAALIDVLSIDASSVDASAVDASPVDASPVDASPVDASPVDASPVDAAPDAPPPNPVGDFSDMGSFYVKGQGNGCSVGSFTMVITPNVSIVVNNFNGSPSTQLTLTVGSTTVASAPGFTVLGNPHTCTFTRVDLNTLAVMCSNGQGGTCSDTFTKSN
jgi:hypothetical protein